MPVNQLSGLTQTALQLLREGYGYRNEEISTGNTNLKDIIKFETEELENTDIQETCNKLYRTSEPTQYIEKHFGKPISKLFGLWLTTLEGVKSYYFDEHSSNEIVQYHIPSNAIIISDLDDQGILLALEKPPDYYYSKEI